jgi:hypothetical protein
VTATAQNESDVTTARGTVSQRTFIEAFREAVTLRVAIGTVAVFVLGLVVIGVSYADWFEDPTTSWVTFTVREVGAGLLVAAIASVVLRIFVERYRERFSEGLETFLRQDVTAELGDIRRDIDQQATLLVTASGTLEALRRTGIERAYAVRGDALNEMRHDVEQHDLCSLLIMGVSLNDFLRSDQHDSLHSVWRLVTGYVKGDRKITRPLEIRILAIDPNCEGALLRSYGESRGDDQLAGRLDEDVKSTARRLGDLTKELAAMDSPGVSFEFRFYRSAPTLFLLRTNLVSYVQPYYFWSRRQFDISMPVFRLEGSPLHQAMHDHFDLIWQHASVDGLAWLDANDVGIGRGALESGVVNVFSDSATAYDRMCWLLDHAKERVWIQGVSLRSFFVPGRLHAALRRAISNESVDVRILVLDPKSEQARYRSFREHQFSDHCQNPIMSYSDYCANPVCHEESTLSRETGDSMKRMHRLLRDGNRTEVRLYSTAPSCFALIADRSVLVEQYHYGKAIPAEFMQDHGTPPVLGKDMALLEYSFGTNPLLLSGSSDGSRNSYDLIKSHFDFVFQHCSTPLPDPAAHRSRG